MPRKVNRNKKRRIKKLVLPIKHNNLLKNEMFVGLTPPAPTTSYPPPLSPLIENENTIEFGNPPPTPEITETCIEKVLKHTKTFIAKYPFVVFLIPILYDIYNNNKSKE